MLGNSRSQHVTSSLTAAVSVTLSLDTVAQVILFSAACLTCSGLCSEVSSFRLCYTARQERAKGCKICPQVPSSRGTSNRRDSHQCGSGLLPACRGLARHRETPPLTQSQARRLYVAWGAWPCQMEAAVHEERWVEGVVGSIGVGDQSGLCHWRVLQWEWRVESAAVP